MHISLGKIIGHPAFHIQVHLFHHFLHKGKGRFPVTALVVVAGEPAVNLILAENAILLLGCVVIGHDKIPEEAEGFFVDLLQRPGDVFPVHVQLFEFAPLHLTEHHVFQQIHGVQALAPLVDGFKDLQRIGDVVGLDAHKAGFVQQKHHEPFQIGDFRKLFPQEFLGRLKGVEQPLARLGQMAGLFLPFFDQLQAVSRILILQLKMV